MPSAPEKDSRYEGASRATLSGILDLFSKRDRIGRLQEADRIDGKSCLITGANRGLGRAVAVELARRGGRVLMACRSGHPRAAEEVKAESGSTAVEMAHVDLADLTSVKRLADEIRDSGRAFDIVVLNAGVVPSHARRTAQGFEEMFAVNYLSGFLLLNRLLGQGSIGVPGVVPRIVFVSSEVHRSAPPIDFEQLGRFHEYGMRGAMIEYAANKLLTSTFAVELARRLQTPGGPGASVHQLCPGPVNSDLAREAPGWSKPILKPLFALFFRSPRRAAEPVVYLCCAKAIEGRTGIYLHLMSGKRPSDTALDEEAGRRLWEASERLVGMSSGPPRGI